MGELGEDGEWESDIVGRWNSEEDIEPRFDRIEARVKTVQLLKVGVVGSAR